MKRYRSNRWRFHLGATLAAFLGLLTLAGGGARAADLEPVRRNYVGFLTAETADRSDPLVQQALSKLASDAKRYQLSCQPDGHWTDVTYSVTTEPPAGDWTVATHYNRVLTMARAYCTVGQALHGDPAVKATIERALSYVQGTVYDGCPTPGNWWWWEIGVPYYSLGPTLMLMHGQMDSALYTTQTQTLAYLVSLNLRKSAYSGQNKVWKAMTSAYAAAVTDNDTQFRAARTDISDVCAVTTSGDGIASDNSFHQHGDQLMTGSYGADFAESIGLYFIMTKGTAYELPPDPFRFYIDYLALGIGWCGAGGHFDPSVMGRTISRAGSDAKTGLKALLVGSQLTSLRHDEILADAKKILSAVTGTFNCEYAGLAALVSRDPTPPAQPVGHRHYWASDYTVHRAPGWYMSLKMLSNRMISAEMTNNEGTQSWHLSDGFMYLVLRGEEYFGNNVWPTLNWNRLPGTTVEVKTFAPGEGYGRGTRSFVGGAFSDRNGVSAMDFQANASALSAKKSWYFFDDEVVFVTSDILCPSGNRVETIVNQWPLSSVSSPLLIDGVSQPTAMPWTATVTPSWVWNDNIGYVFLDKSPVSFLREMRSGRWSDIGTGSTTLYSNPILTLFVDHGAMPNRASLAYAILPNKDAAATGAFASANPLQLLSNTSDLHAVRDQRIDAIGAVFWKPGSIDIISADRPCAVFCRTDRGVMTVAVADPGQTGPDVHVTIRRSLVPASLAPGMSALTGDGETQLSVQTREGRSYVGAFNTGAAAATPAGASPSAPTSKTDFNPARGEHAEIFYSLDASKPVSATIVNREGAVIFESNEGVRPAGVNSFRWDGRSKSGRTVSSGVYLVKIRMNGRVKSQKVVVLK